MKTPNLYTIVKGSAEGLNPLSAFDNALFKAKINDVNIIKISSILPPNCKYIKNISFPAGALVPVAYATLSSSNRDDLLVSAVAIIFPKDKSLPGLIMEYSALNKDEDYVRNVVSDMAILGMVTRAREFDSIIIESISHKVKNVGTTFVGVALWWDG